MGSLRASWERQSPMDGPMRFYLPSISDIHRSNFVFSINFNLSKRHVDYSFDIINLVLQIYLLCFKNNVYVIFTKVVLRFLKFDNIYIIAYFFY